MKGLQHVIRALLKTPAHKVEASLECAIPKLKAQGLANTQIAARLGVNDVSVGRLLK